MLAPYPFATYGCKADGTDITECSRRSLRGHLFHEQLNLICLRQSRYRTGASTRKRSHRVGSADDFCDLVDGQLTEGRSAIFHIRNVRQQPCNYARVEAVSGTGGLDELYGEAWYGLASLRAGEVSAARVESDDQQRKIVLLAELFGGC